MRYVLVIVLLLGGSSLASICVGQPGRRMESPPDRSLVTIVRVKPEMLSEWLDLQKSAVVPALKKAGVKTRTVYAGGIFGKAFEFRITQPLKNFAEFDSADRQAAALGLTTDVKLADKLRKCID